MFSLESTYRGDSKVFTQYTIINRLKKIILNFPKSAAMEIFSMGLKNEFDSRGKLAINVQPTEGLLYILSFKTIGQSVLENREDDFLILFPIYGCGNSFVSFFIPILP